MNNDDVIKMLDDINNYLCREEYHKAFDYIDRKKAELKEKKDPVSKYMDDLVDNLKQFFMMIYGILW